MSRATQNGLKIAMAVFLLLRTLWVPAHLALEPHDHSVPGHVSAALASEPAGPGHAHGDGAVFHVHERADRGQGSDRSDREERSPHAPHPVLDHRLDPLVPVERPVLVGDPAIIAYTAATTVFDRALRNDPGRATATAPGGRSPPPRPPTRAPPLA